MSDKIQFVADEELMGAVVRRTRESGSANVTARRDLLRYYQMLRYELAGMEKFTEPEAKLIVDALNGTWLNDLTTPTEARMHLLADVEDHIRLNGAAKKWGVDSDKLRSVLSRLSDAQALAVLDAVERFWAHDQQWRIEAELVGDHLETMGYHAGDYFDGDVNQTFPTEESANAWATQHYLGVDEHGVGVTWRATPSSTTVQDVGLAA